MAMGGQASSSPSSDAAFGVSGAGGGAFAAAAEAEAAALAREKAARAARKEPSSDVMAATAADCTQAAGSTVGYGARSDACQAGRRKGSPDGWDCLHGGRFTSVRSL